VSLTVAPSLPDQPELVVTCPPLEYHGRLFESGALAEQGSRGSHKMRLCKSGSEIMGRRGGLPEKCCSHSATLTHQVPS